VILFFRGEKGLDNKARLDLDRVVNFVADLKFTGQNILLLGFAEDGNVNRSSCLSWSLAPSLALGVLISCALVSKGL
jgi:hypothetical protein